MLSRLVIQRVAPRVFTPNVAFAAGLRSALVARQLAPRTFLTTAHASEPVAKDSKSTAAKPKAKQPAAKKAGTNDVIVKKAAAKKPKAKAKAKQPNSNDPEARFKNTPLSSLKLKKDEQPPKKAASPYSLYVREQYVLQPKVSHGEFGNRGKEIAARWHQLSDVEKKPYYAKAEELAQDRRQKLHAWFTETDSRIIRAVNIQRRAKHKSVIHSPIPRDPAKPLTPYIQFSQEFRHEVQVPDDLTPTQAIARRAKALSDKWHALSAEERQQYKDKYRAAMNDYKPQQPSV